MQAENKLEEARFFLDKLKRISRTIAADSDWEEDRDVYSIEPKFKHNFSACVQALRSVFDVLLYDYAEKYFKWSRSPEPKHYMNAKRFSKIAKNRGLPEATRFLEWYSGKFDEIKKEHLSYVRVATVHRGGSWMDTQLKDSYRLRRDGQKIAVETEKEIWIAGMPETVAVTECYRVFLLMDEIVKEAREIFR